MRRSVLTQNGHLPVAIAVAPRAATPTDAVWRFRCPACHSAPGLERDDLWVCQDNHHEFRRSGGIWRFLPTQRYGRFAQFVHDYETVRQFEGRCSTDSAYYRALPFRDLTGRFAADWHIRAVSFHSLLERVVKPLEMKRDRALMALDLGAGNGWLSNRLAERGHHVAAIDLLTNEADGLGAHRHYQTTFTPIQAEFDQLPLASRSS